MKKSINWHKGCLSNLNILREEKKQESARIQAQIDSLGAKIALYQKQIYRAKSEKKDSFDQDKFKVSEKIELEFFLKSLNEWELNENLAQNPRNKE